jgi:hypothetical protein
MTDIDKLIEEGLALREKATPGPWQTNAVAALGSVANGVFTKPPDDEAPELFVCSIKPRWEEGCIVGDEAVANANVIAFAGTNLRTLLTALRDSRAKLLALRDKLRREAGSEALGFEGIEAYNDAADRINTILET